MNRRQLFSTSLAGVAGMLIPRQLSATPKKKHPIFQLLDIEGTVRPRGINNNGDISGWVRTDEAIRGFIHSGGETNFLSVPGSSLTIAWGIDEQGRVAGLYQDFTGVERAFLYENGQYTHLIFGGHTTAFGVSEGRVVGYFLDNLGTHGFLWQNVQFTQLDYPGSKQTIAYGINAAGRIVGHAEFDDGWIGFIYENGQYEAVRHPRLGGQTKLYDINSDTILGAVTAECLSFDDPFILRRDRFTLLEMPGTYSFGINDVGQIVGDYGRDNGFVANLRAFIPKGNRPAHRLSRLLDPLGAK